MQTPHIKRHLTAIRRSNLSRPVQLLLETGVLTREHSFFDYGCGFGDDIRILTDNGYHSSGWDPHFAANEQKTQADVVNLGFVLNVIEDPTERATVLADAVKLCGHVLCVGVMYAVDANRPEGKSYRDGIVTQKNTFQRLYNQQELTEFLQAHAGKYVASVAPGVAFVFKEQEQFHRFRYGRVHRRPVPIQIPRFNGAGTADEMQRLATDFPTEWEDYVGFLADRGRPPSRIESTLMEKAATRRINTQALFSWAVSQVGPSQLESAAESAKNDLLVFLAMSLFENRTKMSDLDSTAQADVKHFYGSFTNAMTYARESLLSVGSIDLIRTQAEQSPVGTIEDEGLFLKPSDVPQLPLHVRIYVMLGSLFFGDVEAADLVKVHLGSNKLTLYVQQQSESPAGTAKSVYDAFKIDFMRRRVVTYEFLSMNLSLFSRITR